ncbi:MAG TPA: NUDIX domain-containing protein [Ktedonobacterales bacterium]|nr:NUDIX domain-containing protein [Ktedonobacterales bacterium]
MATVRKGPRVGREGKLSVGSAAVIFDETRLKALLTRRTDNGQWCLPGGRMEPGESIAECCAREVLEETGLIVRVGRLVGVYTNPDRLITYPDGNRWQVISHCFEAEVIGGEPRLSDETTAFGYFSLEEIAGMDLLEPHRERIADAFTEQVAAFVR